MDTLLKFTMRIVNNIDSMVRRGEQTNLRDLQAAAMEWHGEIVGKFLVGPAKGGSPRTGRRYKVPGTKRKHYTASAPGEPPAQRTGKLRSGIRYRVVAPRGEDAYAEVGSPDIYAVMLEKGTRRMQPRPYFVPAFEASRERIMAQLARRWFE